MPSPEQPQAFSLIDIVIKVVLPAIILILLQIFKESINLFRSRSTLLSDIKIMKELEYHIESKEIVEKYVSERVRQLYSKDRRRITNIDQFILGVILLLGGLCMIVYGASNDIGWCWGVGIGVTLLGWGGISNGFDPKYAKTSK